MPVVVANAAGPVGHAVVQALLALGSEVEIRATVADPDERGWFVQRGVPVAVTDLDDAELLSAVLAGAHTLVLLPSSRARPAQGVVLLEALADADVRRVVAVGAADSSWATALPPGVERCPVSEAASVEATATAVLAADARRID